MERFAVIDLCSVCANRCSVCANRLKPQRSDPMLLNSRSTNVASYESFGDNRLPAYQKQREPIDRQMYRLPNLIAIDATRHAGALSPPDPARRRPFHLNGLSADALQPPRRES